MFGKIFVKKLDPEAFHVHLLEPPTLEVYFFKKCERSNERSRSRITR